MVFFFLAFFVVVSVLFYICSIDYETLKIEKKLLKYHEGLARNPHQQQELKWKEEELLVSKNNFGQDGHDFEDHDEGHESYETRVRAAFEHENAEASFRLENSNDVLVMIQIQNSGSSNFERKVLRDLKETACDCKSRRCQCIRPKKTESEDFDDKDDKNTDHEDEEDNNEHLHADNSPNWLFSRKTMGWPCGVHAGWTEMTSCVDSYLDSLEEYPFKRRYFYTIQLRHPIRRFLSEYFKAQSSSKSNTTETRTCRGQPVVIPSCNFTTPSTISLSDFIKCPVNLALNRQTRMLADLSLVNCYNQTGMSKKDYEFILLSSAKANLHQMAFFSLDEYPDMSLQLFEQTFGLRFKTRRLKSETTIESLKDLDRKTAYRHRQLRSVSDQEDEQVKGNTQKSNNRKVSFNKKRKHYLLNDLPQELVDQVKEANRLDMELYEYAKELLFDRSQVMTKKSDQKEFPKDKKEFPVVAEDEGFDAEDADEDDDDDDKSPKKPSTSGHLRTNKLFRAPNLSRMDALTLSN